MHQKPSGGRAEPLGELERSPRPPSRIRGWDGTPRRGGRGREGEEGEGMGMDGRERERGGKGHPTFENRSPPLKTTTIIIVHLYPLLTFTTFNK